MSCSRYESSGRTNLAKQNQTNQNQNQIEHTHTQEYTESVFKLIEVVFLFGKKKKKKGFKSCCLFIAKVNLASFCLLVALFPELEKGVILSLGRLLF